MAVPGRKPSAALVTACAVGAVVSMMAGVYFGGHGQLPPAMAGAGLFVLLVAATKHNRRVLAGNPGLFPDLPRLRPSAVLRPLEVGRHPPTGLGPL